MEFVDLKKQYKKLNKEINLSIKNVLNSSAFIMGPEVKEFENSLRDYVGSKYCLTCANGTDALFMALMALNICPGDAVFVPTFTFYATSEVVSLIGATPIFIDTNDRTFNIDTNKLEKAIEDVIKDKKLKPKAIIAVDLFGQPAEYELITKVAKKYNLKLIEDAAQGFGGSINNRMACTFGDISTTSFFPAKPLGCYGDGGAIFTDNEELYNKMVSIRVHGKGDSKYDNVRVGLNSRLDTLQAAILIPKLKAFIDYELDKRNEIAKKYSKYLNKHVVTPKVLDGYISSWAQYTILLKNEEERNYIQTRLKEINIPSMIYYPIPLHKQTVYKDYKFNLSDLNISEDISKKVLSLPMHPYLTDSEIKMVCQNIIKFLREKKNEKNK